MKKELLEKHNERTSAFIESDKLYQKLSLKRKSKIQTLESSIYDKNPLSAFNGIVENNERMITECKDEETKYQQKIEENERSILKYQKEIEQIQSEPIPRLKVISAITDIIKIHSEDLASAQIMLQKNVELRELCQASLDKSFSLAIDPENQTLDEVFSKSDNLTANFKKLNDDYLEHAFERRERDKTFANIVSGCDDIVEDIKAGKVDHNSLIKAFEWLSREYAFLTKEYLQSVDAMDEFFKETLPTIMQESKLTVDSMKRLLGIMHDKQVLDLKNTDTRYAANIQNGSMGIYLEGDMPFINHLTTGALADLILDKVSSEVEKNGIDDRGVSSIIDLLDRNHGITLTFHDGFRLRLLLIEYYKVVELSTKNNKLDYAKNYLNQHTSLSEKALVAGASLSRPLRNPNELKILILEILTQQRSGDDGYARDAMLELLNNEIIRLPKQSSSK